jgi:competence protein ComEC
MRRKAQALARAQRLGRNPDIPFRSVHTGFGPRAVLIHQQDRLFLWAPVLVATGSAMWMVLPREPSLWALGALACGLALMARAVRHLYMPLVLVLALLLVVLGQFWISWQAHQAGGPVVDVRTAPVNVTGTILTAEPREAGRLRVTLGALDLPGYEPGTIPRKIRISLRPKQHRGLLLAPGQRVMLRAILLPLPDAAIPGGYDFARRAHFTELGGLGFAISDPEIQAPASTSRALSVAWAWQSVDRVRLSIDRRIRITLSDDQAAIASALIVGVRGGIPDDLRDQLRIAGLAHILAISGLHMALMAGGVFFVVRAAIALAPPLALRWSPRYVAAGAGLGSRMCLSAAIRRHRGHTTGLCDGA